MGKQLDSRTPAGVYRDDPDRDDAASTSSAVPMDDMEYPDSDLPAYEDVPPPMGLTESDYPETLSCASIQAIFSLLTLLICRCRYLIHPTLPQSQLSHDETTTTTHYPLYSQDATILGKMIKDQSKYPPIFTARIIGTHTETRRDKEKQEEIAVTDFDIRLDMTHLLVPDSATPHTLRNREPKVSSSRCKAYRGSRAKITASPDQAEDADAYMQSYIASPFPVRSFTLERRIWYYDSAALETLIRSLVGSTNYRGHLQVGFPITRNCVRVYSPCWQNRYREKTWLRWLFYLTFLWIFAWPYLWFITRRWEVVTAIFQYSTPPEDGSRMFVRKSERAFFEEWRPSIRRAVLGKKQGWIDEEYKLETERAGPAAFTRLPSTGSAAADGALGFLHHAVNGGRDVTMAGGWGADS